MMPVNFDLPICHFSPLERGSARDEFFIRDQATTNRL